MDAQYPQTAKHAVKNIFYQQCRQQKPAEGVFLPFVQGTQDLDKKKEICKTDKQDKGDYCDRKQYPLQKESQGEKEVRISGRQIQYDHEAESREFHDENDHGKEVPDFFEYLHLDYKSQASMNGYSNRLFGI